MDDRDSGRTEEAGGMSEGKGGAWRGGKRGMKETGITRNVANFILSSSYSFLVIHLSVNDTPVPGKKVYLPPTTPPNPSPSTPPVPPDFYPVHPKTSKKAKLTREHATAAMGTLDSRILWGSEREGEGEGGGGILCTC